MVRCLASTPAGHKLNLAKCVDKEHAGKSLREIVKLPPGALKGLKAGKADAMWAELNIRTIGDLGAWKHFRAARAIAALAKTEEAGARPAGALANINGIVDQAYEAASFAELLESPPSCLQGLAPWSDSALKDLKITSVGGLAKYKYAAWAAAISELAAWERDDFGSR